MTTSLMLDFDIQSAQSFLNSLKHKTTTLQVLPPVDANGKPIWGKFKGQLIGTGKTGGSIYSYQGLLQQQKQLLSDLKILNHQRYGIFVMVNEGDGLIHTNQRTAKTNDSVVNFSSCFIDTDKGDVRLASKFCKELTIESGMLLSPHYIIQSSANRYHVYFHIRKTAKSAKSIEMWKSIQCKLSSLDVNFDQTMADECQLLRLPGFYHCKKDPFLVKVHTVNCHDYYRLEDLYEITKASDVVVNTYKKNDKYVLPDFNHKLPAGQRHDQLFRYVCHLANKTDNFNELYISAMGFINLYFEDSKEFLLGGARYKEVEKDINDAISYINKDKEEKTVTVLTKLLDEKNDTSSNDDFYLNCPGLCGQMVRELYKNSPTSIPSFLFASSISMLSLVKSFYMTCEYGHAPSNYILCLAPTGSGKDYPSEIISNVFNRIGLTPYLTNGLRSVKGIYRMLEGTNFKALVVHNEGLASLKNLADSKESHKNEVLTFLLEAYSLTNRNFHHQGFVGDKKDLPVVLNCPRLNYLGFGVPEDFSRTFALQAVETGHLPRYIIINEIRDIQVQEKRPSTKHAFEFEETLKSLAVKGKILVHLDALDVEEIENELACTEDGKVKKELEKALKDAKKRSEDREVQTRVIKYSEGAKKLRLEFETKLVSMRNRDKLGIFNKIYSRTLEQSGRIAVALADDIIDEEIYTFARDFVLRNVQEVEKLIEKSHGKGEFNTEVEDLQNFLLKATLLNKGQPVMYRDIITRFKIRDSGRLYRLLQSLIEAGVVNKLVDYRRPGIDKGRLGTAYQLLVDTVD